MAFESQLCRHRGDLALAVGLRNAAGNKRVGVCRQRLVQYVIELAQLVTAEAESARVLALDPQVRTAKMRGQARQRLERCRQLRDADSWKASKPGGEARLRAHGRTDHMRDIRRYLRDVAGSGLAVRVARRLQRALAGAISGRPMAAVPSVPC